MLTLAHSNECGLFANTLTSTHLTRRIVRAQQVRHEGLRPSVHILPQLNSTPTAVTAVLFFLTLVLILILVFGRLFREVKCSLLRWLIRRPWCIAATSECRIAHNQEQPPYLWSKMPAIWHPGLYQGWWLKTLGPVTSHTH